jgi:hypothetical protein
MDPQEKGTNMKIKHALLLIGVALSAVAVAIPASASAAEWTHEGKAFKKHVEIGISGVESLKSMGAELECEFHATITTEGGTASKMTKFEPTGETCSGTGIFGACPVILTKVTHLPWKIDIQENDITVTGVEIYKTYAFGCLVESTETTTGNMTITLNEAGKFSAGKIHALPQTDINGSGEYPSEVSGSYQVEEPNAGTRAERAPPPACPAPAG